MSMKSGTVVASSQLRRKLSENKDKTSDLVKKTKTSGRSVGPLSNSLTSSQISRAREATFGHLKLDTLGIKAEIGKTKVRTHANPLSAKFSFPTPPPNWNDAFSDPTRKLFVDIGCGPGRFSIAASQDTRWKEFNHLGLEIREPLVTRANAWQKKLDLPNCFFMFTNANTSLENILKSYPGEVSVVSVQFPDPHFKKKHHKRRVLTQPLIEVIASFLKKDSGRLFIQSDVESVVAQMRDRVDISGYFVRQGEYSPRDPKFTVEDSISGESSEQFAWTKDGKRARLSDLDPIDFGDWLIGENPIGVLTERESQNSALNQPIYRCDYRRSSKEVTSSQIRQVHSLQQLSNAIVMLTNALLARSVITLERIEKLNPSQKPDLIAFDSFRQQSTRFMETSKQLNLTCAILRDTELSQKLIAEIKRYTTELEVSNDFKTLAVGKAIESLIASLNLHLSSVDDSKFEKNIKLEEIVRKDIGALKEFSENLAGASKHLAVVVQQL